MQASPSSMSMTPAFSPGPADDARAGGGEFAQVDLGRLVRAVLGPHDRKHAQFDMVGLTPQPVQHDLVFIGGQTVFGGQLGGGLQCAHDAGF
jgi:hypothetical protein